MPSPDEDVNDGLKAIRLADVPLPQACLPWLLERVLKIAVNSGASCDMVLKVWRIARPFALSSSQAAGAEGCPLGAIDVRNPTLAPILRMFKPAEAVNFIIMYAFTESFIPLLQDWVFGKCIYLYICLRGALRGLRGLTGARAPHKTPMHPHSAAQVQYFGTWTPRRLPRPPPRRPHFAAQAQCFRT